MAEEVTLRVDMRDRGDPLSRAFDRPGELHRAQLDRERRARSSAAYHHANASLFGQRQIPEPLVKAQRILSRAVDVFADRPALRRAGVFLGDSPPLADPVSRFAGGGGGGGTGGGGGRAVGGGGSRRGGSRLVSGAGQDPLQLGQIFGVGPVGRAAGLRAAGLATLGSAGVGFLVLDAALQRLVSTVRLINRAYQEQIKLLTEFSGPLSLAAAEREVALVQQRLRLAQQFGPNFARTFRMETEFQLAMMEMATEVTATLQPILRALLDVGTRAANMALDIGTVRTALTAFATFLEPRIPGITIIMTRLADWLEAELEKNKFEYNDDFYQDQLNFFARPTETFRGTRRERGVRE